MARSNEEIKEHVNDHRLDEAHVGLTKDADIVVLHTLYTMKAVPRPPLFLVCVQLQPIWFAQLPVCGLV